MFALLLYFHPHYLHAEFYASSVRKTKLALRATKTKTKLKRESVTISKNGSKVNVLNFPMLLSSSCFYGTEEGKGLWDHKEGKMTLVVSTLPMSGTACMQVCVLGFNLWPSAHPARMSVHANVHIITHQQS